jgi:methylenetetrahydrofolate reductase (NADPH)
VNLADRPLSELFAQRRPLRSIEFFPPKDDAGVEALRQTAAALKSDVARLRVGHLRRGREHPPADRPGERLLKADFGYTVMPHLTCVGHSRAELNEIADRIHADGFRNIMALRGDPPKGSVATSR